MNLPNSLGELAGLMKAVAFAAEKHRGQFSKKNPDPYIYHPISVATVIVQIGQIQDLGVLQAALLHDVLEDTATSLREIVDQFGEAVASNVAEVTDDMSLSRDERRRSQLEAAPRLSRPAKQIRIADKICNIRDISSTTPAQWSAEEKVAYLTWAENVVNACQGSNALLEEAFRLELRDRRESLR
jgi:guanosine-3',5'-bis(diphosphate) 3'-pyrophosphohydrolase